MPVGRATGHVCMLSGSHAVVACGEVSGAMVEESRWIPSDLFVRIQVWVWLRAGHDVRDVGIDALLPGTALIAAILRILAARLFLQPLFLQRLLANALRLGGSGPVCHPLNGTRPYENFQLPTSNAQAFPIPRTPNFQTPTVQFPTPTAQFQRFGITRCCRWELGVWELEIVGWECLGVGSWSLGIDLFVPQSLDRVEPGGAECRHHAEEDADAGGKAEPHRERPPGQ